MVRVDAARVLPWVPALLLAAAAGDKPAAVVADAWQSIAVLRATTTQERRNATYGDCNRMGYGYLMQVLPALAPGEDWFPAVRYRDWDKHPEALFPAYPQPVDPDVVVAIDVQEDDSRPGVVARATVVDDQVAQGVRTVRYQFVTGLDVDTLLALVPTTTAGAPARVSLALFAYATDAAPTLRLDVAVEPEQGAMPLPEPLRRFSWARRFYPFVLELSWPVASAPQWRPDAVDVVGIRVDLEGYVVVHRRGSCLTAVRQAALATNARARAAAQALRGDR